MEIYKTNTSYHIKCDCNRGGHTYSNKCSGCRKEFPGWMLKARNLANFFSSSVSIPEQQEALIRWNNKPFLKDMFDVA